MDVASEGRAGGGSRSVFDLLRTPPEKRGARFLPSLLREGWRIAWHAGRKELALAAALELVIGVGLAVQLLAVRRVLADVLAAEAAGAGLGSVVAPVSVLAVVTVMLKSATQLRAERERLLAELVALRTADDLIEVAVDVDLSAYETSDFYDRLQRARQNAATRPVMMVSGVLQIVRAAFGLVGLAGALVAIEPLLVAPTILMAVPIWIANARNSRAFYRFTREVTADDRLRTYLFGVLTGREHAKEVRALELGEHFRARHRALYDERITKLRDVMRSRIRRSIIAGLAGSVVTAAGLAGIGWLLVTDRMTAAEAGTAAWAMFALGQRLRAADAGAANLYESALFMEDFTSFLRLRRAAPPASPAPPAFRVLTVDGVSFAYPGAERAALRRVSLELRAGEIVALVGGNGSGKTTLAKLLAGLYRPDGGRIAWDGADISTFDPIAMRRSVAILFQDFIRYHLSARDNIGLGRVGHIDDLDAVIDAARRAEADGFLRALPHGYETLLSTMFTGGSDLSGGQWQRVALARATFRDAPFLIMDEPTAALDARAESEIFDGMRALARGRCVLLISHRFSSVRSADRIYVLHEGEIVEQGTHESLMAERGRYAEMFTLQAAAYLDGARR